MIGKALRDPAPPPGAAPADDRLLQALRRMQGAPGRVVLRVEEAAPHRRKVARALLQEGALAAGGQVLDGPRGDLLLVGAEAGRAERLRRLLERLVGPAGTLTWSLEHDGAALRDYAEGAPAAAPCQAPAGPSLASLDGHLAGLDVTAFTRRTQGPNPGGRPAPRFLRLEPDRARLAGAMGLLGGDADLLDHAARHFAARLLAALARPEQARALLGAGGPARLHLPLPADLPTRPGAGAAPGTLVATLPLAAAADPAALEASRARLEAAGIGLELDGLDAESLALLDPRILPPVLLRLRWSAALAAPDARATLAALDPARIVLAGAEDAAAHRFAAAVGIVQVEGVAA
ncbi:hypothetical protein DFH01_18130 [Falsiroseomonas bella]|uniref:EAL domain-containing protein n=1 Tax=Falsiroseomonas bella TaxID=2184016 RepID=A0A317FAJ7_9PROT|nr:hypothetical protein [Falsiroseomonas bella]PWS35522.1 hypothetical protein DFH01_18130 [Falsiroseomonas bella]